MLRHGCSNRSVRLLLADAVVQPSDACPALKEQRALTTVAVAKRKLASTVSGEQSDPGVESLVPRAGDGSRRVEG